METPTIAPAPHHPKFVRWALLIGIVVILNVFFFVVEQIAFPEPDYAAYCPQPVIQAQNAAACDAQGGIWTEYPPQPTSVATVPTKEVAGYCDYYAKCQAPYEAALGQQHLYAFILMTVLGVIALAIGLVPIGSSIVSSGLSYGGVLALIIGAMQYWGDAGNWLRLGISAVALGALLYIGWRRFRD